MIRLFISFWLLLLPILSWANVTEHKLDGDVSFWLKAVPSSNTVSIHISFLGGDLHDPKGKEGAAMLASGMLWAGTKQHSELEFLNALEDGSINLNFWASDDRFHAAIYALKNETPKAVDLMFEAMLAPDLSRSSLKIEKQSAMSYLKEQALQPNYKFNVFMNEIITQDQPFFQRLTTAKTVKRIKLKDLKQYYKNTFTKEHMVITITGNITAAEVKQLLTPYISKLPQKGDFKPLDITLDPKFDGKTHVFEQDVEQATVFWLQKGIYIQDPQIYKLILLNEWLGGAGGILKEELREKQGLTYNVSTDLQTSQFYQLYSGQMAVDNNKVERAAENIRSIWQQVKENNQKQQGDYYLSAQELDRLKKRFANAWSISFTDNAAVNNQLMRFRLANYDVNAMEDFIQQIQDVSYEDMQDFIEKFLQPTELTLFTLKQVK